MNKNNMTFAGALLTSPDQRKQQTQEAARLVGELAKQTQQKGQDVPAPVKALPQGPDPYLLQVAKLRQNGQLNARQLQEQAQKELDDYRASEAYAQNRQKRNEQLLQMAMDKTFTANSFHYGAMEQAKANERLPAVTDEREEELKKRVEETKTQAIMEADLLQLQGWSQADRAALDSYIIGRDQRDAIAGSPMTDNGFLPQLPENVRQLIRKYGQKRVDELAETLTRQRNAELTRKTAQDAREAVSGDVAAAIGHNAASIPVNAVGGLTGLMGYLQELGRTTKRYPTLDPNNAGNLLNVYGGNVRGQTALNIAGDQYDENGRKIADGGAFRQGLSYVYQGAMGIADTYARALMGGGSVGGATLAATNTFAQTVSEASAQGATPGQAVLLATAKAGIEALSEKIPLDELVKTAKAGKQTAMQIAKVALAQAGIEATTEEISLFGSILAESAILGEKSAYKDMTAEELLMEVAETGIVSGLSGAGSSVGASVVGNLMTPAEQADKALKDTAQQLVQKNTAVPEETGENELLEAVPNNNGNFDESRAQGVDTAKVSAEEELSSIDTRGIEKDMDENTRYGVLSEKRIKVVEDTQSASYAEDIKSIETLPAKAKSKAEKIIKPLAERLGILGRNLKSPSVEIDFQFSKNKGLKESLSKQLRYGGGYADFAKALTNLDQILKNAVLIEKHGDKYKGTTREDRRLESVSVLIGACRDGDMIIPVQMEIKKSSTNGGQLYVTVAMTKIEADVLGSAVGENQGRSLISASEYSLPELFGKINPTDKHFLKYVPDGFLSDAQKQAKQNAFQEDAERIAQYQRSDAGNDEGHTEAVAKGTGAAERDFSGKAEYQELLSDDNAQRDRPGDVRPMEVPKTDGYGRHVTEFAGNAYGAEVTSDRMANEIESLIQDGALGFDRRSNKESLENAYDAIYGTETKQGKGEAGTLRAIRQNVFNGKVQDGDIEKALLLYAKHAGKEGKRAQEYSAELMVDLATMANMTGRNLQLFKLLRRMTPEGQMMAIQKNVSRYVDSLNQGRSKKNQAAVEIPQELEKAYLTATTDAQRESAMDAIYKNAAAQIKPTLGEMWDAWRNLSMLGNPKTHIRNIFGSGAFRPYVSVKRTIGAALESMVLEQENRTKAVLGVSQEAKGLLQWARADAGTKAAMDAMDFSGTTGNEARNAIEDARRILPGVLDDLRKQNMEWMEGADMKFKQREYAYSLASFLKARGYSTADLQNGKVPDKVLQEGRQLAVKEAQKATFNDRNKFSDAISKFRVKGNDGWSKALNVMAKGIMPFTRTPANILVRAKEYSPIELARGLDTILRKVKTGDATVAEGLDQLASGVTGTGAMLLGTAMAAGLIPGVRLVGKIEDEDELREGAQEYSLQVGDTYYGISWLAPANIPLFIGANLYNSLSAKEETGELDAWDYISGFAETCSDIIDPMLELSCLSSLADAVENVAYEESGGDMLLSMMATAATSYFTQGLPTLLGQAEQATEATKSSTFSNADNPIQRSFERTVGNASKRIPGVDLYQVEKLDEFGNPVENPGPLVRTIEAFFSPFTRSQAKNDPLTREISRLHDSQPEKVAPPTASKTISYTDTNGERHTGYHLTADEYNTLAKVQGQTAKDILDKILESDTYAAMTDAQKASVFEYVYDYAREKGRTEALAGYEGINGWMQGIEGNEADAILDKAISGAFSDAFDLLEAEPEEAARALDQAYGLTGDSVSRANFTNAAAGRVKYFMEAKSSGVSAEVFTQLYGQFRSIDQDPDLNTSGKAAQWSYQLEKAQEAGTITREQKDKLKDSMVYYQMFPAETAKFDQMTEAGISADDAVDIGKLLEGIKPQEGYTTVRPVQKVSAIAGSDLTEEEKTAVMKIYLSDGQDENLDLMLELGYSAEDYAAAYEVTANTSGKTKIIRELAREFGVDWNTAKQLYQIFK